VRYEGEVKGKNPRTGESYASKTFSIHTRLPQALPLRSLEEITARYIRPDSVILRENLTTGSSMQKNGKEPWIPSVRPPPTPPSPTRWPFYLAFALLTLAAAALPSWLRRRQSAAAR
jgi:hypothetical protein